jgi:8-oxo-dGTP diphosphatase
MVNMPTHIVAAAGIVENDQNEILLVKTFHNGWVFPGGQVEVGENIVDAVKREIIEESGIEVEVGNLIAIYSNTGKYLWYDNVTVVPTKVMFDFVCTYKGGKLTTSEETSEVAWIPKENVMSYIQAPAIKKRFEAYLQFNGHVQFMEYVTHPTFEVKFAQQV